jgi:hypothetical protein
MTSRKMGIQQKAARLLFILTKGSERLEIPGTSGEIAVFNGATRLHAMAFWVRYPDYLAEELLDIVESEGDRLLLTQVAAILQSKEPHLGLDAMIRFHYGAWEKVDEELAVLGTHDLIRLAKRIKGERTQDVSFLVKPRAFEVAERIEREFPLLGWYASRMELVLRVVNTLGESGLKKRQYLQQEYAETQLGQVIPAITQRVQARFELLNRGI